MQTSIQIGSIYSCAYSYLSGLMSEDYETVREETPEGYIIYWERPKNKSTGAFAKAFKEVLEKNG